MYGFHLKKEYFELERCIFSIKNIFICKIYSAVCKKKLKIMQNHKKGIDKKEQMVYHIYIE